MKRLNMLTMLLALNGWIFGQTFLSEDFSAGTIPPTGWTIDAHSANWSVEASAKSGGISPEAAFYYDPSFNETSRLISPYIDLTGYTSIKLMFKHFLDDYAGSGYTLGVATRTGTGTWNTVWSVSPSGDIGPEERIVDISNGDVGSPEFQFCIFFDGDSYNLDWWYIDDILLFIPYDLDGAMAKITTPAYFPGTASVMGIVRNIGNTTIHSMDVTWTIDGISHFTTSISGLDLEFSESVEIVCDDLFSAPIGGYDLNLSIDLVNGSQDDNPDNNSAVKAVNVVSHVIARKPCFEEFTSSTCSPCATFNQSFNPWSQTHEDEITLIKYQMNWPGSGDPYYTAEGGVRRNYYGVSYVPWPQCNGAYVDYNITAVQQAFNDAILQPGLTKIAASHTLSGTEISVTANFLPFADFNDFRAHIIVIENTTTGNVASNGETEFHHVMMKMMPDANGTVMNVQDRNPVSITETFDLAGTNIEEFDDLSVVVLFQDYTSKEIYQSAYSIENGTFAGENRCSDITMDGITIPGFSPDVFQYTIELPEGAEIPVIAATGMDPNSTVIVEPTWELPGTTWVDCFGEDLISHAQYMIDFELAIGVGEPTNPASLVKIYPNPASDKLSIQGARNADVIISSVTGKRMMSIHGLSGNSIDISCLTNGIYMMQVIMEDDSIVTRKFTVVR